MIKLGKQYNKDDKFKRLARYHQSIYRKDNLSVEFNDYGNRLQDDDAKNLLNYYQCLNVRKELRKRYPNYSQRRDADMLRSEHIPFNLFSPLKSDLNLAKNIMCRAFGVNIKTVTRIDFEYAPKPISQFLNDGTAFDTYIEYISPQNEHLCGIGIEVKYTEKSYKIGNTEKSNVENKDSRYWSLTRISKIFKESNMDQLAEDDMRQIWRNHLLGISMVKNNILKEFTSVVVYPSGNTHFNEAIPAYKSLLTKSHEDDLRGCTFEKFIASIENVNQEILNWKEYLSQRYIVQEIA